MFAYFEVCFLLKLFNIRIFVDFVTNEFSYWDFAHECTVAGYLDSLVADSLD